MKRNLLFGSTLLPALLASAAMGQVVNFQDANTGQLSFPGVGYDEMFAGQGAYSDPGNDIWNGFGQYAGYGSTYFYSGATGSGGDFAQQAGNPGNPYAAYNAGSGWVTSDGTGLFNFAGSATTCGNSTSGGVFTPITLAVKPYAIDQGLGNAGAFAVQNGSPNYLLGEAAVNTSPEVFTLQKVPAGTYGLYLYGASYDNNRGTTFSINSGNAHNGISGTLNSLGSAPANSFVEGENFVIFENVTPDASGNITITATPNAQDGVGNKDLVGEVDVNGFQLIFNPPPTAVGSTLAQNVFVGGTASFSFSPAFAAGASYQWQSIIGGVTNVLSDNATITGSKTTNLLLASIGPASAGLYQCVITTAGATGKSPAAPLTILSSTASAPLTVGQSSSIPGYVLQTGDVLTDFNNDGTNTAANAIPPYFDMGVGNASDGTLLQYVNFGANAQVAPFAGPVGFSVTPLIGPTVATGIRFFTASSHPEDDPADYLLEGSNNGGTNYTVIAGGLLGLPAERNAAGGVINITNQILKEIDFANTTAYRTYRLTFTNVNNNAIASNGLQIAEVQLLGTLQSGKPGIAVQPPSTEILLSGATLSASVTPSGSGPFSYSWLFDGTATIVGATNATLTMTNVQTANSGTYTCVISNSFGWTNSAALEVTVPTATPYEAAVVAEGALAYYPLDETNGVAAYDYLGDAEGTYETNASPGQGGIPNPPFLGFAADNLSVLCNGGLSGGSWVSTPFGTLEGSNDLTIPDVTLTCWINPSSTEDADVGLIVNRSGADGGLGFGTGTSLGMLTYIWNNNNGDTYNFVSNLTPPAGQWSFVALTISPTQAVLYMYNANGRLSAVNAIPHSNGVMGNEWRVGNDAAGDPGRTFTGNIAAVAVFPSALTPDQIGALYDAASQGTTNVAPVVAVPSTPVQVDQGGNGTISASVTGPGPFSYQWYYLSGGVTNLITGATNSTLSLSDILGAQSGYDYYVVVSNKYGVSSSAYATLNIISGAPTIVTNISPLLTEIPAGLPVTFSVAATGTEPFTYHWSTQAGEFLITTNPTYTFDAKAGSNNYTVVVSNSVGFAASATAAVVGLTSPPPVVTFNTSGAGWSVNEGSTTLPTIGNNVLTLTMGVGGESGSAFFNTPQYIGGFIASYVYQPSGGGTRADGTTFCIQNDPNTTNAVGGGGGELGFYGVTNSASFEINVYVYANGGAGVQFGFEGETPDSTISTAPYFPPGLVNVNSGDPIYVKMHYIADVWTVWLGDMVTGDSYSTNIVVDLPAKVGGSSAYIGFTGADGGDNATQTVTDFSFSYTTTPILTATSGAAGAVIVSWPVSVSTQLILQQSASVTGPWTTVTAPALIVDGENQVVVPSVTATSFFRLSLQ